MKDNNNSVQSIDRVLDILEALSAAPQGLALSELAAATSLTPAPPTGCWHRWWVEAMRARTRRAGNTA